MAQDTVDTLLADIRVGAMIPVASAASLDDTDLLRLADREMQIGIVPLVMSAREEYFVTHTDLPFTPPSGNTLTFRIPYRAIGGKLREVNLLSNGAQIRVPQLGLDDLEQGNTGFYVEGNLVTLFSPFGNWQANTIRLSYYLRPNRLVPTASVAVVQSINTTTGAITLTAAAPSGFPASGKFDLIRAVPGYDSLAVDVQGTVAGSTVTVSPAALPAELQPGDYICNAEEANVPQIPSELHPVLAQRVIVKALEALGDAQGMQAAQAKLAEMQSAALSLITPRIDGEPKRVTNRSSPFRRRRRQLLY